ncbi:MAG: FHA domain-containing protein [Planctomycetaceae bacterium]|jgi:pSer/pThr/pTyr-binding forkhead associated (FHA) protein|nr:FHA domain-containing protein [Planctomycetaceae bacterium]
MDVKLVVASGSRAGQAISINLPKFFIGRAEDCHLKPKSELISRYHCAIITENGGYVAVRDMQSKNGVYVNGERISSEKEVKTGDKLVVGPLEFEFQISVSVQGEKKPKVESVKDAVVRTVAAAAANAAVTQAEETAIPATISEDTKKHVEKEEEITDWLMGDGDEIQETETIELSSVSDEIQELYGGLTETPLETETRVDAPEKTATPAPHVQTADSRDAAANLLKNFFKGGR